MEPHLFAAYARNGLFFSALLFAAAVSLNAQDKVPSSATREGTPTYRAGGLSIAIPSPGNDLIEPGPDYRVVLEPLAPANNRLVAAFVTPDKMSEIRKGNLPAMTEYALLEIPRHAEFAAVDTATFKQIADAMSQQFGGDLSASTKEQQDELNRRLKALGDGSTTVTIDKQLQLGSLFSKPDECGYAAIVPYSSNGVTTRMAMALAALRVQNRVLLAYTFAVYKDESTVKWIRTTEEQWADAILKVNRQ
jgi:hypothetical protein